MTLGKISRQEINLSSIKRCSIKKIKNIYTILMNIDKANTKVKVNKLGLGTNENLRYRYLENKENMQGIDGMERENNRKEVTI
jgi:hypothetical protein